MRKTHIQRQLALALVALPLVLSTSCGRQSAPKTIPSPANPPPPPTAPAKAEQANKPPATPQCPEKVNATLSPVDGSPVRLSVDRYDFFERSKYDAAVLAHIVSVKEFAKTTNGEWDTHWYLCKTARIWTVEGVFNETGLDFICRDSWPAPGSSIKASRRPFPYRKRAVFLFYLRKDSPIPIITWEERSRVEPYGRVHRTHDKDSEYLESELPDIPPPVTQTEPPAPTTQGVLTMEDLVGESGLFESIECGGVSCGEKYFYFTFKKTGERYRYGFLQPVENKPGEELIVPTGSHLKLVGKDVTLTLTPLRNPLSDVFLVVKDTVSPEPEKGLTRLEGHLVMAKRSATRGDNAAVRDPAAAEKAKKPGK